MIPTMVAGMLDDGLEAPSSMAWTASAPSRPTRPWICPTISPRTASAAEDQAGDGDRNDEDGGQREERIVGEGRSHSGNIVVPPGGQGAPENVPQHSCRRARLLALGADALEGILPRSRNVVQDSTRHGADWHCF